MTKKDGDKLRKMKTDLLDLSELYEQGSLTNIDLIKCASAIDAALQGKKFSVTGVNLSEVLRTHRVGPRGDA